MYRKRAQARMYMEVAGKGLNLYSYSNNIVKVPCKISFDII